MKSIENDPIYQSLHNYAVPLGGRERIDWSQCGLAKVGAARRIGWAKKYAVEDPIVAEALPDPDQSST